MKRAQKLVMLARLIARFLFSLSTDYVCSICQGKCNVVHFDEQDGQILSCLVWWVSTFEVVVSIFGFHPGQSSNLTHIFQICWSHQLAFPFFPGCGRTCRRLLGARWSQIFGYCFTEGGTVASTRRWCNLWTWGALQSLREPQIFLGICISIGNRTTWVKGALLFQGCGPTCYVVNEHLIFHVKRVFYQIFP